MRFKCGPNEAELRRKRESKALKREGKVNHLRNWHRFFTLIPRQVSPGDCRWLEYIERRCPTAKYNVFGFIEKEEIDYWCGGGGIDYRAIKK